MFNDVQVSDTVVEPYNATLSVHQVCWEFWSLLDPMFKHAGKLGVLFYFDPIVSHGGEFYFDIQLFSVGGKLRRVFLHWQRGVVRHLLQVWLKLKSTLPKSFEHLNSFWPQDSEVNLADVWRPQPLGVNNNVWCYNLSQVTHFTQHGNMQKKWTI